MSTSGAAQKTPCPGVPRRANPCSLPAVPGLGEGPALGAGSIQVSQGFGDNSQPRTCSTSSSAPVNTSSNAGLEEVNYLGLRGRRQPLALWDPKQSLKHLRQGTDRPFPKSRGGCPPLCSPVWMPWVEQTQLPHFFRRFAAVKSTQKVFGEVGEA